MKTTYDKNFDPPAPFGEVVVRNIKTGERSEKVRMLLDTGADISILPAALIESIGIEISSEKQFTLVGFDGTENFYDTVETQLVFLGKRFSGLCCVLDDEIGILGRDVLNELRLLFDGPRFEWEEIDFSLKSESIS